MDAHRRWGDAVGKVALDLDADVGVDTLLGALPARVELCHAAPNALGQRDMLLVIPAIRPSGCLCVARSSERERARAREIESERVTDLERQRASEREGAKEREKNKATGRARDSESESALSFTDGGIGMKRRAKASREVSASLFQAGIHPPPQLGMGGGVEAEAEKGEKHWTVNKPEPLGGVGALLDLNSGKCIFLTECGN